MPEFRAVPDIENVITAQDGRFTYRVMAYRHLSEEERISAVWKALQAGVLKEPPPGGTATLLTEIGKPHVNEGIGAAALPAGKSTLPPARDRSTTPPRGPTENRGGGYVREDPRRRGRWPHPRDCCVVRGDYRHGGRARPSVRRICWSHHASGGLARRTCHRIDGTATSQGLAPPPHYQWHLDLVFAARLLRIHGRRGRRSRPSRR